VICDGTTCNLEFRNQPEFALYVNIDPDAAADGNAGTRTASRHPTDVARFGSDSLPPVPEGLRLRGR
jgi:hypothetical protein